jgi:hypothetical protein
VWSEPGVVTATVVDSNALLPGSTFELRASPREGGSSARWCWIGSFVPIAGAGPAMSSIDSAVSLFASMLQQALKGVQNAARA